MISAKNMTVWAICWSGDADVTSRLIRVLRYCRSFMDCEQFMLLSAAKIAPIPGITIIPIQKLSSFQEFNVYVNNIVPQYINSRFAMSVHEDGFPIRPSLWSEDFLKYDYIGAPWPTGVVGNGGFNIESKKLMRSKLRLPRANQETHPSDNWVCLVNRATLEKWGNVFAPTDVAMRFSTEFLGNGQPSFGFHGRTCCPVKYAEGWKAIERFERK